MRDSVRFLVATAIVFVLLGAALWATLPVRGMTWTQTSELEFLAGERSNVEVLPSGDLQLAQSAGAWTREGVVLDLGPPGALDDALARAMRMS